MNRISAIILAAGSGSRMRLNVTKQQLVIAGESVLSRSVRAFQEAPSVCDITVVVRDGEVDFARQEISGFSKVKNIIIGGSTRPESARIGFESVALCADYVAIHDAARCLVTPEMIESVIADAIKHGAATASAKVTDTIKEVDGAGFVNRTIDRTNLRSVQTPQIFKTEIYRRALMELDINDPTVTDDNMLVERIGVSVWCTDTGKSNIKITTAEDLVLAEYILSGGKANV